VIAYCLTSITISILVIITDYSQTSTDEIALNPSQKRSLSPIIESILLSLNMTLGFVFTLLISALLTYQL
jgi:hypothetical protein